MVRAKARISGTRVIVYSAFFVAILIVLAQIAIPQPFSPVPITLGLLAVLLCGGLLGPWLGLVPVIVYITMGMLGLPVFAGFSGVSAIIGPTGGYILGYIPAVIIAGLFSGKGWIKTFAGMVLAVLVCYVPGVIWTTVYLNAKFLPTLVSGLFFLPFDLVKAGLAGLIAVKTKKHLKVTI